MNAPNAQQAIDHARNARGRRAQGEGRGSGFMIRAAIRQERPMQPIPSCARQRGVASRALVFILGLLLAVPERGLAADSAAAAAREVESPVNQVFQFMFESGFRGNCFCARRIGNGQDGDGRRGVRGSGSV